MEPNRTPSRAQSGSPAHRPAGGLGVPVDPLMAIAWRDCLIWAARQDNIVSAFEADTGMYLPASTLDRMIDLATGFNEERAQAFVVWFNKNVWGPAE